MVNNQPLHIVFTLANNSSAPYFNWFAERSEHEKSIKLSFICLYPEKPKMIEDVGQYGCDCYWVKYDDKERKKDLVRATWDIYQICKKIKPDVIHSHLFDDALPTMLAGRLAGVKIRANTRGDASYHYYYAPTWFVFDKFNNWNSTHIVAISEECKDFVLDKEKADPIKVTRIHHGIPVKEFTNQSEKDKDFLKNKYNLHGKKVIGTVSRLIEWKGYRYIIEAAKDLVKIYPDIKFLFVGTGPQKEELEDLITQYNLNDHVILVGWMERSLIPSFYGVLDVYLHAASNEPFGFVIAEAMMNSAAVISTKTGAALDAINHLENGYLIEPKDSHGIIEGIQYILSHNTNELRQKAASTATYMYNFERMWQDYIDLYKKTYSI